MKIKRVYSAAAFLGVVILAFGLQNPADHRVLFEKAKFTMETKGDLAGAIKLFKEIIEKFPDEAEYAAKSQFHIGICYEKSGQATLKQAREAFQKVVDNYPGQTDSVKAARERLTLLAADQAKPKEQGIRIRQVAPFSDGWGEKISPDGAMIAFTTNGTGDIAIRDVKSGQIRRLTTGFSYQLGYGEGIVWSPDSRRLAYCYYGWGETSLHILPIEGGETRILHSARSRESYLYPADWSPDGKTILAELVAPDPTEPGAKQEETQLVLVSVADGSMRALRSSRGGYFGWSQFSPDGTSIVFDLSPNYKRGTPRIRDIFLISTDGKIETILVENPADDAYPFWTPDGKMIVFISDRLGTVDLWGLSVENTMAKGDPQLIRKGFGNARQLGLSREGTLFYVEGFDLYEIFQAEVDLEAGRIESGPWRATGINGSFSKPRWSPDGKRLAYVFYDRRPNELSFVVKDLETGAETALSPGIQTTVARNWAFMPQWFPGGQSFLVRARNREIDAGYFEVDARTGQATLLLKSENDPMGHKIGEYPVPSLNGKRIYAWGEDDRKIAVYHLDSGEETTLLELPIGRFLNNPFALSPDGQQLVFTFREKMPNEGYGLMIISTTGGAARELYRLPATEVMNMRNQVSWLPDGRSIFFSTRDDKNQYFWLLSSDGGQPRRIDLDLPDRLSIDWMTVHPNGRDIAYVKTTNKRTIMAMENFLPKSKD